MVNFWFAPTLKVLNWKFAAYLTPASGFSLYYVFLPHSGLRTQEKWRAKSKKCHHITHKMTGMSPISVPTRAFSSVNGCLQLRQISSSLATVINVPPMILYDLNFPNGIYNLYFTFSFLFWEQFSLSTKQNKNNALLSWCLACRFLLY